MAGNILIFKILSDIIDKPIFIYTIKTKSGDLIAYNSADLKLIDIPADSNFVEVKGNLKVDEYDGLLYPMLYDKIPYIINAESDPTLAFWDDKNKLFIDSDGSIIHNMKTNEPIVKIKIPTIFFSDGEPNLEEMEIRSIPYIPMITKKDNNIEHSQIKSTTPIIPNSQIIMPSPKIKSISPTQLITNSQITPFNGINMEEQVNKLHGKINEINNKMNSLEEENIKIKNENNVLHNKINELMQSKKVSKEVSKEVEKDVKENTKEIGDIKNKLDITYYSLDTLIRKLYGFEVNTSPYPLKDGKYVLPAYGELHNIISYDDARKYINPATSKFTPEVKSYELIPILQPFGGSYRRNNRMITIKLTDGKIYHIRAKYDNNTKQISPPQGANE